MDKVDVLAVMEEEMDRRLTNYNAATIGEAPEALVDRLHVELHEMATARAAVAELIAADEEHDAALAAVMEAEGYGHGRKQLPGAHPLVHALGKAVQRRRAALASVKAD